MSCLYSSFIFLCRFGVSKKAMYIQLRLIVSRKSNVLSSVKTSAAARGVLDNSLYWLRVYQVHICPLSILLVCMQACRL